LNELKVKLATGLYFVGTPLGTARDITLRALDVLASADFLAAEDTRSLRRLMEIHGISLNGRHIVAYHDHSGPKIREKVLDALAMGQSVAYASEAGMPLIADPGFDLGRAVHDAGYLVTSAPGPTAFTTAMALAGLATDSVLFDGFLPSTKSARRARLETLKDVPSTLAFYESPKRAAVSIQDMADVLGPDREAALCRELTKKFEEIRRMPLAELADSCRVSPPRGEIVVLIDRGRSEKISEVDLDRMLSDALESMSVKDAADAVATATGFKRRQVYQRALALMQRG
jgi:16S rRNA (cytidine1402-2'-O)-methyltransferase